MRNTKRVCVCLLEVFVHHTAIHNDGGFKSLAEVTIGNERRSEYYCTNSETSCSCIIIFCLNVY